jgi:glycosyltransferase involved in cell wall biosynthesis
MKRKSITNSKLVIVGLARDCEETIETSIRAIESAFEEFQDASWIIVESDSTDSTVETLISLQESIDLRVITLGRLRDSLPKRTQRIAACRNEYVKAITQDPKYEDRDFVVVADLDGVNTSLTKDAVHACWNSEACWDACFANQSTSYYDVWALRHDLWSPNDCWRASEFLQAHGATQRKAEKATVLARMIKIDPSRDPFEVDSAFGGLGIYRKDLFDGCEYLGLDKDENEFCEHVWIHAMMKKKGASLFIIPAFINGGWNEHSERNSAPHRFKKSLRRIAVRLATIFVTKKRLKSIAKRLGLR